MSQARKSTRTASLLHDIVYGANDGIITTFSVVAGVVGAGLSTKVVLIIGFANLFADGFSMATSDYLATKSEHEVLCGPGGVCVHEPHHPERSAFITFFSFVLLGVLPLLPYVFIRTPETVFLWTVGAVAVSLFFVGMSRAAVTHRRYFQSGLEMLALGGVAAAIAYGVGFYVKTVVG